MGEWLRRLDRILLPPAGRVLHRLARGARRLRLLTVTAMTGAVVVLLVAVWTADRAPLAAPVRGDVVRVGVSSGESVPDYLGQSRRHLAELLSADASGSGTELYALVSLEAYLAPGRLTAVLGDVAVSRVYARVPLPHTQTEIVPIDAYRLPADVVEGMRAEAERKDAQAREYRARAAALAGADAGQRRVWTSGAAVAADEAAAYRGPCSCVYAAVVRATPAALELLAGRAEVRAVDPAPTVLSLDQAVFLPPLPEQVGLAVPPDDNALDPSSAPGGGPNPDPRATSAGAGGGRGSGAGREGVRGTGR